MSFDILLTLAFRYSLENLMIHEVKHCISIFMWHKRPVFLNFERVGVKFRAAPPPSQPTYIFSLRVERESDLAVTQSSDFISDHVNCCVLSRCGHWHLTPWRILKHIDHISLGPNKGAHRHAEIPDSAPNNKSWVSMFGIIVLTAILRWQDFQNSNFCVHI